MVKYEKTWANALGNPLETGSFHRKPGFSSSEAPRTA